MICFELESVGGENFRLSVGLVRAGVSKHLSEHSHCCLHALLQTALWCSVRCVLVRVWHRLMLYAHMQTRPQASRAARFLLPPSLFLSASIGGMGPINQAVWEHAEWINKWISWHVQTHFFSVLIWPADLRRKELLQWPERLNLIDD